MDKPHQVMTVFFRLALLTFVLPILCSVGCGGFSKVSGTVTFEDGKPLNCGYVVFESPQGIAKGKIGSNGFYTLSSRQKKDGAPLGAYKVYIVGASIIPPEFTFDPEDDSPREYSVIDPKYSRSETTPLTCEIKGSMTFDVKVPVNPEKPKKPEPRAKPVFNNPPA